MRILHVTYAYFPDEHTGGPPVKVRALAEGLATRGHHATVLTAERSRLGRGRSARLGGVDVVYLGSIARLGPATTFNPGAGGFARRHLHEFDLVHLYGFYDVLWPQVAWHCHRHRVPYVLEPMGMFRPVGRGVSRKRIFHSCVAPLVRRAAAVVATSELERDELIDEGVSRASVVVRRNGIDLRDLHPVPPRGRLRASLRIPDDAFTALFLGRLTTKKRPDLLLDAFASLREPAAHLVFVGPDESGWLREIERRARHGGLAARVHVVGPRYGRARAEAFVDADVFVLPSESENFGTAAAEAMACGVPVVVSDHCGIAPLVAGRAGLVVPLAVGAVAEALQRLKEDPGLRRDLAAGARTVADELGWEGPLDETEALYHRLRRGA